MRPAGQSAFSIWRSLLLAQLLVSLMLPGFVHGAGASIGTNQSIFQAGDNLTLSATVSAGNDAGIASDIYVTLRTPQDAVVYLDNTLNWSALAAPIVRNFTVADFNAASFYSIHLPAGLTSGTYLLQAALVPAGSTLTNSAAWLGSGTSTFTFGNPPVILGISSSSIQPGSMLVVSGTGFDPYASPSVRFNHASGYTLTVPAISATSSSLTVPVPPLVDMTSGEFSSGNITIQVTQASGSQISSSYAGLYLNAPPSATTRPAGTLTLAFLRQTLVMAQQHQSNLSTSTLNTTQVATALERQLNLLPSLISAVEQVMANPAAPLTWGSVYGRSLTLDTNALRNSDRLLLSMLAAQAQAGGFAGTGCEVQNRASTLNQAYYASTGQSLDVGTYGSEYGNCSLETGIGKGFNFVIGTGTVAVALMAVAGAPAYALVLPGAALLYLTVMEANFDFSLASAFNDPNKSLDGLNKLVAVPIDLMAGLVLPETAGIAKDLYQGGRQVLEALSGTTSTPTTASIAGSWSGTWQWSGSGNNGCYFNDGGALSLTITQSGTSFTGSSLSATGIETRNNDTCALMYIDSASGGSASGTISGTSVDITYNMPTIQLGNTLVFSGTGTLGSNTLQGSLVRSGTGGSGSFTLTRY